MPSPATSALPGRGSSVSRTVIVSSAAGAAFNLHARPLLPTTFCQSHTQCMVKPRLLGSGSSGSRFVMGSSAAGSAFSLCTTLDKAKHQ